MFKFFISIVLSLFLLQCCKPKKPLVSAEATLSIPFNPEHYVCHKISDSIIIDGKINDEVWLKAPWSQSFVDICGSSSPVPPYTTRMKLLWDDAYLYLAAELIEPHIWGSFIKHDTMLYLEDVFEVFIDTDGSTHQYLEFQINPLGTTWDLLMNKPYRDGGVGNTDFELNGLLQAIHIDGSINEPLDEDEKWTIELAFPWSVFSFFTGDLLPPAPREQWRMNFSRVDWMMTIKDNAYLKCNNDKGQIMPERYWVWSPQGRVALHQPETWGYVQFSSCEKDTFIVHLDEQIKWALRQVYYRQTAYYKQYNSYTNQSDLLHLDEVTLGNKPFQPELKLTDSGYIAAYLSTRGDSYWCIRADGLLTLMQK